MNIADVEINGDVLSVSVPRESLAKECRFILIHGLCWSAVAVLIGAQLCLQDPSAAPGVIAFCCFPLLHIVLFAQSYKWWKYGKTFTFNLGDDSVWYNGKVVCKISSITRFEMSGMNRFSSADRWPTIWIALDESPRILLLKTFTHGNIRYNLTNDRNSRLSNGKDANVAAQALCAVLTRFCDGCMSQIVESNA
jgi:hypothetical protein